MGVKFNPFTSKLDIVDSPSGEFSDIELALGTQTAPSLSFTGDPDTGIYSPGADQLAISTNGTGRLFVDASGNVGVGILPSFRLHINEPITTGTNQSLQRITTQSGGSFSIRCSDLSSATPNWEFFTGASEDIVFSPSTTERLRITSDGKVGIGTTSPSYSLDVLGQARTSSYLCGGGAGFTGYNFSTSGSGAGVANVFCPSGFTLAFGTNSTERARIDPSGRLLVGTPTARTNFDNSTVSARLQVEGVGASNSYMSAVGVGLNSYDAGALVLARSGGTTIGGNTLVANNDYVGSVRFMGNDGSEFVEAANIQVRVDNTPGANDMPGRLVFSTTAAGASIPTERMRIKASGIVNIANTPTYADNAAALVGGLVAGDVYRKSDGTLMITY